MATDNEALNQLRQACKTVEDLADWYYQVSDDDATTTRRISADIRHQIGVIVQKGEEVLNHAE